MDGGARKRIRTLSGTLTGKLMLNTKCFLGVMKPCLRQQAENGMAYSTTASIILYEYMLMTRRGGSKRVSVHQSSDR